MLAISSNRHSCQAGAQRRCQLGSSSLPTLYRIKQGSSSHHGLADARPWLGWNNDQMFTEENSGGAFPAGKLQAFA